MLHFITSTTDSLIDYTNDDPVRPEISKEFRVSDRRYIAAIVENQQPSSIVCLSLHDFIPATVDDLSRTVENPTICVAYSIWSYKPGSGKKLIMSVMKTIREHQPSISRIVTLSPKTSLAAKFHINNGAFILRENEDTINYEYPSALWF